MLREDAKRRKIFIFNCEIWAGRTKKHKFKIAYKQIDIIPKKDIKLILCACLTIIVSDKRYLLTIINHFSKYGWIDVLSDKSATAVLRAIKECIETHGKL